MERLEQPGAALEAWLRLNSLHAAFVQSALGHAKIRWSCGDHAVLLLACNCWQAMQLSQAASSASRHAPPSSVHAPSASHQGKGVSCGAPSTGTCTQLTIPGAAGGVGEAWQRRHGLFTGVAPGIAPPRDRAGPLGVQAAPPASPPIRVHSAPLVTPCSQTRTRGSLRLASNAAACSCLGCCRGKQRTSDAAWEWPLSCQLQRLWRPSGIEHALHGLNDVLKAAQGGPPPPSGRPSSQRCSRPWLSQRLSGVGPSLLCSGAPPHLAQHSMQFSRMPTWEACSTAVVSAEQQRAHLLSPVCGVGGSCFQRCPAGARASPGGVLCHSPPWGAAGR